MILARLGDKKQANLQNMAHIMFGRWGEGSEMKCPRYAAQRSVLFSGAVQLLGNVWLNSNEYGKLYLCLYGARDVAFSDKSKIFFTCSKIYSLLHTKCLTFSFFNFFSYVCVTASESPR